MKHIRTLFAAVLFFGSLSAAAADPVYPSGVRVGLTPLIGLAPAKAFVGFETEDQSVKVLVAELPAAAYGEVESAFKANPQGSGGVKPETLETAAGKAYYTIENATDGTTVVRRYSMILPGATFSGYVAVQVPQNASKIYTDDAVRQMFASAVVRKQVPVDEQLGTMPFKVGELSDFKNVRTLAAGAAIILADNTEEAGFEFGALHGDRHHGLCAGTAGRPRPLRATGRNHDTGRARRPYHHVRTGPDRRHAGI